MNTPIISKSKYLNGLQCHKLLWFNYNAKDQIPAVDAGTQAIFEQGHLVGEYAKKLFPDGIEIKAEHYEIERVLAESQRDLQLRRPLFEAGFQYKDAFARVDILNPVGTDAWDIIEVKSSTEAEEVHLNDVALQRYVYEGCRLKIRSCWLYFINNKYIRNGDIEPEKLFSKKDITNEVNKLLPGIENNIKGMLKVIQLSNYPKIQIGPFCNDPYECPLIEKCWNFLPKHNILTLKRIGEKGFKLVNEGITDIRDISNNFDLTEKQKIQIEAVKNQVPHINREEIRRFLDTLEYPLFFLDFETFMTAIPLYNKVRPYQTIPFQYSLHIKQTPWAKPEHYGFLANGKEDPRMEILLQLKERLGNGGSIVAYNAVFEKGIIHNDVQTFTEFSDWWKDTEKRFIDLLTPFRSFYYYHPEQYGSASLKNVLPALIGKSYEGMEIADGLTASNEFLRVIFGDVDALDRQNVLEALEKYCGLDTMSMVWIVEKLKDLLQKG